MIVALLAILAYICICLYCAQTGAERGLHFPEIFMLAFFGTPVVGYLHMVLVFIKKTKEQENIDREIKAIESGVNI